MDWILLSISSDGLVKNQIGITLESPHHHSRSLPDKCLLSYYCMLSSLRWVEIFNSSVILLQPLCLNEAFNLPNDYTNTSIVFLLQWVREVRCERYYSVADTNRSVRTLLPSTLPFLAHSPRQLQIDFWKCHFPFVILAHSPSGFLSPSGRIFRTLLSRQMLLQKPSVLLRNLNF